MLLGYSFPCRDVYQSHDFDVRALKAGGCEIIFQELASASQRDRPELQRMLDHLSKGDTVVVWKLDRLSRSIIDLSHILGQIGHAGAGFRSITEGLDTTTEAGPAIIQTVKTLADFERATIRHDTFVGLAIARIERRNGGRPRKLAAAVRREIAETILSGRSTGTEMARLHTVSQPMISRIVAEYVRSEEKCALDRIFSLSRHRSATGSSVENISS